MLEVYGYGRSRWAKIHWMLNELGVSYEAKNINLPAGEHYQEDFKKLNPFSKTPVLKDDDFVIYESQAILNYLGEKYPESGLVPKSGTIMRAQYDQWMYWASTELEQSVWRISLHAAILPEEKRVPEIVAYEKKVLESLLRKLDPLLEGKTFLIGDRFGAADIAMTYLLSWIDGIGLLGEAGHCRTYIQAHKQRLAYPKYLYS